jgi:hypothetical protein
MEDSKAAAVEYSIEDIDKEIIARGAQIPGEERFKFADKDGTPERDSIMEQVKKLYDSPPPLNPALRHFTMEQLFKQLISKTQGTGHGRGIWFKDDRLDVFDIRDGNVKRNSGCTAAICMKENLIDTNDGYSLMKVKNYGKTFNLCEHEPFQHQPIAAGPLCTGFLVKKNVIATVGHFMMGKNTGDLRIVFGFKMRNPCTPVIRIANENIYKGADILRAYNRGVIGDDWALIKLDRDAVGRPVLRLSGEKVSSDQSIYVIGHPCGLPRKYAPGSEVWEVVDSHFGAGLDLYMGNSGSPVFDSKTHEAIGMVVQGDNKDFRCTGKCWVSVIYSTRSRDCKGPRCTMVFPLVEKMNRF